MYGQLPAVQRNNITRFHSKLHFTFYFVGIAKPLIVCPFSTKTKEINDTTLSCNFFEWRTFFLTIYFEHFFEPLIGRITFLRVNLTAQKSSVKLLSNYLRAQKSGFNLLSAFLSEFYFLSVFLSTQKPTQSTSEPLCSKVQCSFLNTEY